MGTPLQVAGRYRQARTVRSTLRSPAGPPLCRIRGLCTRPSAPMMKLTLTLSPASIGTSSGSGVVNASGGWVSSQRERALECGTLLNSVARAGVSKPDVRARLRQSDSDAKVEPAPKPRWKRQLREKKRMARCDAYVKPSPNRSTSRISSARLLPDRERSNYIAINPFREVRRVRVKAIAYFIGNVLPKPAHPRPRSPVCCECQ